MKRPFQLVQLTVTCANISGLLSELNIHGIMLHHVHHRDEVTTSFCIRHQQLQRAVNIIGSFGGEIDSSKPASGRLLINAFLRRPVLILGCILLLAATFYLPTRILFVTVSGNERLSRREILSAASDCGVDFFCSRREIRSEKVKNRLLSALPELKWVGVNTKGCVAKLSVRERAVSGNKPQEAVVSSLVASRDGIIRAMTVTAGNPICRVGQAVEKGQLLVSGYSDCGRCLYGTRSDAEIYAQTRRPLCLLLLTERQNRGAEKASRQKYGLVIGKKRINFYKGSGIYDTTCVRMYVEYPLILPGGFQLPVALTVETQTEYETVSENLDTLNAEVLLSQNAIAYLESQMIAGKVEHEDYRILEKEGAIQLEGHYLCDEMIGQIRSEEIMPNYEQTG